MCELPVAAQVKSEKRKVKSFGVALGDELILRER